MAKIPFDKKYWPEIESGRYKVVTEHGEPVEIVKWDCKGKYPILAVINDGDTDDSCFFGPDGTSPSSKEKLFILTDEPELTEFEKGVEETLLAWCSPRENSWIERDYLREKSAKLLYIAREQIMQEYVKAGVKFVNEIYLDQIKKEEYQKGYSKGQEDAEKLYNEATSFHYTPTPVQPTAVFYPPCFWGAPCTNPQHDCINCPRQGATDGPCTTGTNIKQQ